MNRTKTKDIDLAKVEPALRRASEKARRIAVATNTPLIVYENGRLVRKMIAKGNIMGKTIWRVRCMEDKHPGLWQRWYKNQCVAIGFSSYSGCYLREKPKNDPAWEKYRKYLIEMQKDDYVIATLPNNRIGRIGEITDKAVEDDQWQPLVPKSKGNPHGGIGRRIFVRWDLSVGPINPDLVIKLPEEMRFKGFEALGAICKIKSNTIDDIKAALNDSSNWVGLFGKFGYERALSDYIANYPHHLEENLTAFPDSKIREKYFEDKTRADVLLMDKNYMPVIVECKQNSPTEEDIEQLKKYMSHLSDEIGQKPRGILVHGGSPKVYKGVLRKALNFNIEIINYKLDIEFRKSF